MASKSDGESETENDPDSHNDAADILNTDKTMDTGKEPPIIRPSKEEIKMQAMKILEIFLQKQQQEKPCDLCDNKHEIIYQRVYEEEHIETDGPIHSDMQTQGSTERKGRQGEQSPTKSVTSKLSKQGSIHSLLDEPVDFPYADDSEEVLEDDDDDDIFASARGMRSSSVPAETLSSTKQQDSAVHSWSTSPSSQRRVWPEVSLDDMKDWAPNQESQSADGMGIDHQGSRELKPVGPPDAISTEKSKSSSPFKSSSESREILDMKTSERKRFKSGSVSSLDTTDTEQEVTPKRKKKPMFTRLKQRIDRSRTRDKIMKSLSMKKKSNKNQPIFLGKGDMVDSPGGKRSDVLEEQHKHIHGHIEQHHYQSGDHSGLLREEELWESTDINYGEKSQQKHIERHEKVKESTKVTSNESSEEGGGGLWGMFKRVLSFRKRPKQSVKESQSSENIKKERKKDNDHNHSILVHPQVSETEYSKTPNGQFVHHTSITTSTGKDVVEGIGSSRMLGSHGDSVPIQVSEGTDLDKVMRERSFVLDFDSKEVVRTKVMESGQVDVVTDRHVHQRFLDTSSPKGAKALLSDTEKEELYAKVANRLGQIGDSYVSPKSESATSSLGHSEGSHHHNHHSSHHQSGPHHQTGHHQSGPHHHHSKQQPQQASAINPTSDEVDGEGLTPKEREIRDVLREIGDQLSGRINISPDAAHNAAMDIARHATYNTFSHVVKKTAGEGESWDQLALVFLVTKQAVRFAGQGGALAVHVKDTAAQFIADKFAGWIVDQGGWDTVLESTGWSSSELESGKSSHPESDSSSELVSGRSSSKLESDRISP